MKTKKLLIALTLACILTSCRNADKSNTGDETAATDTIAIAETASTLPESDTIVYDTLYFPADSILPAKALTTGVFHGDEVWDNAHGENWFGLFKGKTGFYLAETKIKTQRVFDVILDEGENEKTGWEVSTINKDTCFILVEKQDYLTPRNIQEAVLSKNMIFPGDTLRFKFLDNNYKIFATGGKKRAHIESEWFDVWNYKLYVTATIKGKQHTSLLVAKPKFDDAMINILFAGDIDGDSLLDLIIDTSSHYNATSPTIYLSKPAESNEIVKPVGGHTSVGC